MAWVVFHDLLDGRDAQVGEGTNTALRQRGNFATGCALPCFEVRELIQPATDELRSLPGAPERRAVDDGMDREPLAPGELHDRCSRIPDAHLAIGGQAIGQVCAWNTRGLRVLAMSNQRQHASTQSEVLSDAECQRVLPRGPSSVT